MKIIFNHKYEDLISIDNLLSAWQEFIKGKRSKEDVQIFSFRLMDNMFSLHGDLKNKTYRHGGYQCFKINDPKPRTIHKAIVRDRLLHHAVYRTLYPFFDKTFISDSFSCRDDKGTHKAVKKIREYASIVSKNNTRTCWILKCDIKKFFASIDQNILTNILEQRIPDRDTVKLLNEIIFSFKPNGLPLGNLTSQLFANVYLNEFDQFVKHKLKVKYYIRYADDFIILSENKNYLKGFLEPISNFLQNELKLILHSDKIFIETLSSGVEFLGWINFFDYKIIRKITKQRAFRNIKKVSGDYAVISSYFGLLRHGNTHKVKEKMLRRICEKD